MGKKTVIKVITLVILMGIMAAAVAPIHGCREPAGQWMARLEDSRSLSSLSLPGTHDSGAMYSIGGIFGKCQTLGIAQQLDMGVRFLDLRLRLVDDRLWVYHNFVEQQAGVHQVMGELAAFLEENPTEFLILSLKEEDDPLRSAKQFTQELEAALRQYPQVVSMARSLPEDVGSARGKIHILARYEGATLGLDCAEGWVDNDSFELGPLFVQDHYRIDRAEEKQPDITAAFAAAASEAYGLVLNYTSCYLTSGFPPSYAGTPAHTVNPWLLRQLEGAEGPAGVVVCDFITSELSQAIIGRNFS